MNGIDSLIVDHTVTVKIQVSSEAVWSIDLGFPASTTKKNEKLFTFL